MARYKIELPFDTLIMDANLVEASANIGWIDEDGERHCTQWQTADARHDEDEAAILAVQALGTSYWLDMGDEYPDDEREYIRGLIISVEPEASGEDKEGDE